MDKKRVKSKATQLVGDILYVKKISAKVYILVGMCDGTFEFKEITEFEYLY